MRAPPLALAAALLLGPAASRAAEPEKMNLVVGEETEDLGVMPRCDDLSVVAVKASGRGVRAIRPGTTICSFDTSGGGGIRRVIRIVVSPRPSPAPTGAGGARRGEG